MKVWITWLHVSKFQEKLLKYELYINFKIKFLGLKKEHTVTWIRNFSSENYSKWFLRFKLCFGIVNFFKMLPFTLRKSIFEEVFVQNEYNWKMVDQAETKFLTNKCKNLV